MNSYLNLYLNLYEYMFKIFTSDAVNGISIAPAYGSPVGRKRPFYDSWAGNERKMMFMTHAQISIDLRQLMTEHIERVAKGGKEDPPIFLLVGMSPSSWTITAEGYLHWGMDILIDFPNIKVSYLNCFI